MSKRAEFLGFRDDVVHGQDVTVKVFDVVMEPTVNWDNMINRAMGADPFEVECIWNEVLAYKQRQLEWESLDSDEEMPQLTAQSRDRDEHIIEEADTSPSDENGELIPVDTILLSGGVTDDM